MTNLPFKGQFTVTAYNGMILKSTKKAHKGIDLVGVNKKIYSVCDGIVIKVEKWNYSYGYHIYVKDRKSENIFIFAHLSRIDVIKGQNVSRESVLGEMGATGNATGPHLHIEMLDKNGNRINEKLANYFGIPESKIGSYNSNNYKIEPVPQLIYKSHCQNIG